MIDSARIKRGMAKPRYVVHPVADAECDSLNEDVQVLATDDLEAALRAAAAANAPFGAGIKDTTDGRIDFGFGFGIPCPENEE